MFYTYASGMERNNKDTFCLSQVKREGYDISDLLNCIEGVIKHHLANQIVYTKTGLVFGFSKNQILVAVIPGLKSAEDFTRLLALGEGKIVFGFSPKTILRCV